MAKMFRLLFILLLASHSSSSQAESVLDTFPALKKFVATERQTNLYFGFGLNPFSIVNSKIGFSASLFQLHWIKDRYDFELLNASFGSFFGGKLGSEQFFLVRAAPKYKVFKNVSIGPIIGMEFVHFPDVSAQITKNNLYSPSSDFSTVGAVYGATLSQTFDLGSYQKANLLRISESVLQETYSVKNTNNGWSYYYQDNSLNGDPAAIAPNLMFMLEVSYLF
ncbi:MAG: hypothetical protein H7333_08920 [Bdellovibrionales bacterium]|nr:hypothetical protein [Oligoflexia bacterium]